MHLPTRFFALNCLPVLAGMLGAVYAIVALKSYIVPGVLHAPHEPASTIVLTSPAANDWVVEFVPLPAINMPLIAMTYGPVASTFCTLNVAAVLVKLISNMAKGFACPLQ